jgi:uncharacterized protein (DUF1810 family)
MDDDPHDLQRFIKAQTPVYALVCAEHATGTKASHWMWFIFAQLKVLGRSSTAQHFGIASRAEAEAYWRHPVLGARLKVCTNSYWPFQARPRCRFSGYPTASSSARP